MTGVDNLVIEGIDAATTKLSRSCSTEFHIFVLSQNYKSFFLS